MLKKILITSTILIIVAVLAGAGILHLAMTGRHSTAAAEVEIKAGASVHKIAEELTKNGVISTPKIFEIYARIKRADKNIRVGTYEFPAGTTLLSAFQKMERGEVKQYAFTIIEGWSLKDIAAALQNQPFVNSPQVVEEFLRLTSDPNLISALGFQNVSSLEGYLFPDTYLVTKPFMVDVFIKRLVGQFKDVWGTLDVNAIAASGLNEKDILTLASIVEKETGAKEERPLVASVFLNRLKIGMPLQSDPTIIYGLPDFDGNIRKPDITNPHPYNTYVHRGLPPGPIANPGRASILAVINPAKSDYLYFVSKNDGTHFFSANLADHSKAVGEYQRAQK